MKFVQRALLEHVISRGHTRIMPPGHHHSAPIQVAHSFPEKGSWDKSLGLLEIDWTSIDSRSHSSQRHLTSPIFQLASTPSTYLSGTPLWVWHLVWLWGHPAVLEGVVSKATTWAWWDCNSSFPCCFVSNAQRPHSTRSQGERRGSGGGCWNPRDGGLPQPMRKEAGWQGRLS